MLFNGSQTVGQRFEGNGHSALPSATTTTSTTTNEANKTMSNNNNRVALLYYEETVIKKMVYLIAYTGSNSKNAIKRPLKYFSPRKSAILRLHECL